MLEEELRGMGNNLKSQTKDVAEQYESQIKDPQTNVGDLVLDADFQKIQASVSVHAPSGTRTLQVDLLKEGNR